MLDLDIPTNILLRTDEWIFGPKAHYECEGDVDNVVFPCGWIKKKKVLIYYGAADSRICLANAMFDELVDFILRCPDNNSWS